MTTTLDIAQDFRQPPVRRFWFDDDTAASARSVAEERRHRQERLAGAFRLFARYGFDPLEDAVDYGRVLIPATRELTSRLTASKAVSKAA